MCAHVCTCVRRPFSISLALALGEPLQSFPENAAISLSLLCSSPGIAEPESQGRVHPYAQVCKGSFGAIVTLESCDVGKFALVRARRPTFVCALVCAALIPHSPGELAPNPVLPRTVPLPKQPPTSPVLSVACGGGPLARGYIYMCICVCMWET